MGCMSSNDIENENVECNCDKYHNLSVSNNNIIYVIGMGVGGEFGMNYHKFFRLTLWNEFSHNKSKSITYIHCGNSYNIFSNINDQYFNREGDRHSFYGSGMDAFHGSEFCLNITTYFKNNKIKIKTICTNVASNATYWIDENNKLYENIQEPPY